MRHKNTYIFFGIISILLIASIIVSAIIGSTIKVENILNYKQETALWKDMKLIDFDQLRDNIKSPLALSFFHFGIGGISEIPGFAFTLFTLVSIVIIPLLLVLFLIFLSVLIVLFGIEFLRRDSEVRKVKNIGKYGMYIWFIISVVVALIGIIILCSIQNSLSENLNASGNYDTFALITFLSYLTNGTVFNVTSLIENNQSLALTLIVGITFMVVLLPISVICLIIFGSMYIGAFVFKRENKSSRFFLWLKNVRIDALKDYVTLNIKNPWIWLMSSTYIFTVIIPGLVHPYTEPTQIIMTVVNIILLPIAFLPLIYGYFMARSFKRFHYNRLIFIQIVILLALIVILQLNSWIILKDYMFQISWLSAFIPFVASTATLVSVFGFIKFSEK